MNYKLLNIDEHSKILYLYRVFAVWLKAQGGGAAMDKNDIPQFSPSRPPRTVWRRKGAAVP